MSEAQERTRKDTELMAHGIQRGSIMTLQAVQVIVDAMTALGQPNDPVSVAARTGFSLHQIRQVLNSPEYSALFATTAQNRVAPMLVKNLAYLQQEVDKDLQLGARINLNRELRQTWETLVAFSPTQAKDDKINDAIAALDSIKARKAIVRVEEPCSPTEPS